eukprot:scaffold113090_cov37-Tisochrysis_lutea.AAC.4
MDDARGEDKGSNPVICPRARPGGGAQEGAPDVGRGRLECPPADMSSGSQEVGRICVRSSSQRPMEPPSMKTTPKSTR